jgi:hypothetical protein
VSRYTGFCAKAGNAVITDKPSNIALNFMFIYDIRNKFILYLYRLSNGEYFLVADEFINVFYVIPTKDES